MNIFTGFEDDGFRCDRPAPSKEAEEEAIWREKMSESARRQYGGTKEEAEAKLAEEAARQQALRSEIISAMEEYELEVKEHEYALDSMRRRILHLRAKRAHSSSELNDLGKHLSSFDEVASMGEAE